LSVARLDRASLLGAVEELAGRDRRLARIVRSYGPPPLWARPAGFATLLRIILEQQVSLASAKAMYRRLSDAVPGVSPRTVTALGTGGLQRLGFTRQKAGYAFALAERVQRGELALAKLARMPDAAATAELLKLPGVGPWTAGIYLLMALRRPDVWPPGDLALHKAIARLDGRSALLPSDRRAEELVDSWRPYRAVAARLLWHAYLSQKEDRCPKRPSPRRSPRSTALSRR
jgi:DNA-3-methyladenine glycosylase II